MEDCPGDVLGNWVTFVSNGSAWLLLLRNGRAERLAQVHPRPAGNHLQGRLLGETLSLVGDIGVSKGRLWFLPLSDQGQPAGASRELGADANILGGFEGTRAEISEDGRHVAFASARERHWQVHVLDTLTGAGRIIHSQAEPAEIVFIDRSAQRVFMHYLVSSGRPIDPR